jgi:response regulator RpfG family c-di-GMP phosphodiesterase
MEKTLLVVDDEENIIRALRRLFRHEPFSVITATSGAEGLDILSKQPVAVILSDQRMPGMIGSEFLKAVKERYPHTIRLVMSGYTELESITSAINDGAVFKFLLKPWEDEKLLTHIRDAFSYHDLKSNNILLAEELKKANARLEEKVREEREKNALNTRSLLLSQELLDRMPIAVFGVSNEGLIVMANQYARRLVNQEAVVGNVIDDVIPETITQALYTALTATSTANSNELYWPDTTHKVTITPILNSGTHCFCLSVV